MSSSADGFGNGFSSGAPQDANSSASLQQPSAQMQRQPLHLPSTYVVPATAQGHNTADAVQNTPFVPAHDDLIEREEENAAKPPYNNNGNDEEEDVPSLYACSRRSSALFAPKGTVRWRDQHEEEAEGRVNFGASTSMTRPARKHTPVVWRTEEREGIPVVVDKDGVHKEEELSARELARLYAQKQAALMKVRADFDFFAVPDWVRLHPMFGCYIAEAIGTFAWVLILSLTSVRNQSIFDTADDTNMTAVPIGFVFTSMVFTFAYVSGAHFNPAISIAVFLLRKMDLTQCFGYILCQLCASIVAGLTAMLFQASADIFVPSVSNSYVSSGIFSEMIYTFAIVIVVLNVGYSRQSGNFFYGFAVGMTMAAGSSSVGRISGGAFNPAAATGLQLAVCLTGNCADLKTFWIYWLAPIVGSALAALLFSQMQQPTTTHALGDTEVIGPEVPAALRYAYGGEESDEEYEEEQQHMEPQYGGSPVHAVVV